MFADLLWVETEQVVAGGNSSLTMMHDCLVQLLLHGGPDSPRPWSQEETVKFICPVPGYDRHFTMLASYGIEMLAVPMQDDGPDVAAVRELVKTTRRSRGCGSSRPTRTRPARPARRRWPARSRRWRPPPRTSASSGTTPTPSTTSPRTRPRAPTSSRSPPGPGTRTGRSCSRRPRKITFAGSGVAFLAASKRQRRLVPRPPAVRVHRAGQGQPARHAQFFGSAEGVREHMAAPRDPRARSSPPSTGADRRRSRGRVGDVVAAVRWLLRQPRRPRRHRVAGRRAGQGCRDRADPGRCVVPARHDPRDRNIRLAPSFPVLDEVQTAMAGVATCVLLAAAETALRRARLRT